jgi:HD-GYP domain-containing protein (c-di-GMP phosphodiesterase class II)
MPKVGPQQRRLRLRVRQSPEDRTLVRTLMHRVDGYVFGYSIPLVRAVRRGDDRARSTGITLEGERRMDGIRATTAKLIALESDETQAGRVAAESHAQRALGIAIIGLLISLGAVAAVARFLRRWVVSPLRDVAAAAESLAGGALEARVPVEGRAESARLSTSFNEMAAAVERAVAARTGELESSRRENLHRLALAAEYRDDDTSQHAQRIAALSCALGEALGFDDKRLDILRLAAPLHDIGKIGIPDGVLLKPGRLTAEEFDTVKTHTLIGARMLAGSSAPVIRMAERIALSHHERWDGTGYPMATSGDEIPLEARIVAVADVFDALAHERPYKAAWPVDEARDEILRQAGSQFDPAVVEAFAAIDPDVLELFAAAEDSLLTGV